jgi:hypothetical protein
MFMPPLVLFRSVLPMGKMWGRDGDENPHRKALKFNGLTGKIPKWGEKRIFPHPHVQRGIFPGALRVVAEVPAQPASRAVAADGIHSRLIECRACF